MKPPLFLQPGQQIGRWTLHERTASVSLTGKRAVFWCVTCSCNPEVKHNVSENSLRRTKNGASRSCGCLRRDRLALDGVQAAINLYFRQCKAQAKRTGRVWELTLEAFTEIVLKN